MIPINNTLNSSGRFANHFIRNMYCHILAEKYDLAFTYSYYSEIKRLGIRLFVDGKHTYKETEVITDEQCVSYLIDDRNIQKNIVLTGYVQVREVALYLRDYFTNRRLFDMVVKNNPFKERYNENNDVYVHLRLAETAYLNHGFDYYDGVLSGLDFHKGFISSDEIQHPICQALISKYRLKPILYDEVRTILFASTCKHIVLSNGSFSWLIGFLGIYSSIYYPDPSLKTSWHGDIFVYPDWNKGIREPTVPL